MKAVLRGESGLSLTLFEELLEQGEVDFYYERRGGWLLHLTEAGFAEGRREAEALRAAGFPVEVLDGDAAREREPAFSGAVLGALFLAGDAHGLSLGFAESLVSTPRRMEVRIETGVRVTGLLRRGGVVAGALTRRVVGASPGSGGVDGTVLDRPRGVSEERDGRRDGAGARRLEPAGRADGRPSLAGDPGQGSLRDRPAFPRNPSRAATGGRAEGHHHPAAGEDAQLPSIGSPVMMNTALNGMPPPTGTRFSAIFPTVRVLS